MPLRAEIWLWYNYDKIELGNQITLKMEDTKVTVESLFEKAQEYGKTSLELLKLRAVDITSDMLSSFLSRILVVIIVFIFFNFLNFGIAIWLGDLLGKIYYGFFIVAAFYGIVGIIFYSFLAKWIKTITGNFLINQMLNNDKWEK